MSAFPMMMPLAGSLTVAYSSKNRCNTVKIGTQLILRRLERGDARVDLAVRINNAINRMDAMIQNLLDASRLRAGQRLTFEFEDCYLDQLLQEVVEDLSFSHRDRFIVVADSAIKSNCSRKQMRRVIENLATNAVKYGAPDTPITITLQQSATCIELTIHNEGNPIAPEAQPILFQQFRRTVSAEDQTGWGLGLFLAKSIVEAHQGTIEVESAEGEGTSFIVKLPVFSAVAD